MHFIKEWSVDVRHISSFTFRYVRCIVINFHERLIILRMCPQIYISHTYFCTEDSTKCRSFIRATRRASVECYELSIARASRGDFPSNRRSYSLVGCCVFLRFSISHGSTFLPITGHLGNLHKEILLLGN